MITLGTERAEATTVAPLGGVPLVWHSPWYDAALHRAMTEKGSVDGPGILEQVAATATLRSLAGGDVDPAELFDRSGLGQLRVLSAAPGKSEFALAASPIARARLDMFGKASQPVCDVARGVIAGLLESREGASYTVREVACVATGAPVCHFVASRSDAGSPPRQLPTFDWPRGSGTARPFSSAAPLPAWGERRLWTELYARASLEFEAAVPRVMGSKFANLPAVVLTEAAHLGTFYAVGSLLRSPEWSALVEGSNEREEWVHALIAGAESLGWGAWKVQLLAPEERCTVHIEDGYEALGWLAAEGRPSTTPRCYFARGFVAGLMNVVFAGDVLSVPKLDQQVYNSLFRSPASFRTIETRCRAMGDPYCELVANPLSPGLRRG